MNSINSKIIKFNYLYNFYCIIILLFFILYNIKKNIKFIYIQVSYLWFFSIKVQSKLFLFRILNINKRFNTKIIKYNIIINTLYKNNNYQFYYL